MKIITTIDAINLAKKNNQKGYNFLFEKFWGYIFNYQLKKTNNEEKAEDITIRTLAQAFDKIETFNSNFEFKTWLIAISKNIHIDQSRKDHSLKKLNISDYNLKLIIDIPDSNLSPEDKLITKQNFLKLLFNIKSLKNEYKYIIHLRFFEELSYKEISVKMNQPLNTIKVKLLRAKKLLANKILNES